MVLKKSQSSRHLSTFVAKVNKRPKCVVCNKVLKIFERNLCSCQVAVCIKHAQRVLHACPESEPVKLVKVVAPKILKI